MQKRLLLESIPCTLTDSLIGFKVVLGVMKLKSDFTFTFCFSQSVLPTDYGFGGMRRLLVCADHHHHNL